MKLSTLQDSKSFETFTCLQLLVPASYSRRPTAESARRGMIPAVVGPNSTTFPHTIDSHASRLLPLIIMICLLIIMLKLRPPSQHVLRMGTIPL